MIGKATHPSRDRKKYINPFDLPRHSTSFRLIESRTTEDDRNCGRDLRDKIMHILLCGEIRGEILQRR